MNEPHHLSKLVLDRYLTGELSPAEQAEVEGRLDDRSRTHLEGVAQTRSELPGLDIAALRARARDTPIGSPAPIYDDAEIEPARDDSEQDEPIDAPIDLASRRRRRWGPAVLSGVLLAAAALFAAVGTMNPAELDNGAPYYGVRGGPLLELYVAQGAELFPYEGTPLGAGDVLGFRVTPADHNTVVLLSVDGTGMVSVYFPSDGTTPQRLEGKAPIELPGTVMLDGAPGPEVFVAVFGQPADRAKQTVRETYWTQGHQGLRTLGERPDMAVAEVKRR